MNLGCYIWERESHDAWSYSKASDGVESWLVIGHAKGTEGNLAIYGLCEELHYPDGTVEVWPPVDGEALTYEKAYELYID